MTSSKSFGAMNQFPEKIYVGEVRGKDAEEILNLMTKTVDYTSSYLVRGSTSTGMTTNLR